MGYLIQSLAPHWRRVLLFLLCFVIVVLIGVLDLQLGYEFSIEAFYVIPVALVSWELGENAGFLVSFASAAVLFLSDSMTGAVSVHLLEAVWKGVASLGFFLLVAWLVAARKQEEKRRDQLMTQLKDSAIIEERNRMAAELHDTLAQGFTGIIVQLEAARCAMATNREEATASMENAQNLARASLRDAQRSVWALRSTELEDQDLTGAVQEFTSRMAGGTTAAIDFSVLGTPYLLPDGTTHALLRICQEAVVNALRHAEGSKIQVQITYQPSAVELLVRDNGRGFDSQTLATGRGFGLMGMRERAGRIGAHLEVQSEPGSGTRVVAVVRTAV